MVHIHIQLTCQSLLNHDTIISKLTSDCNFGDHFAVSHFVAGNALVAPSVLGGGQVDLEIPSVDLGPRGQAAVELGPRVGQRRGAMGQTLQPDHLPDPHGHIIGHRRGIRKG